MKRRLTGKWLKESCDTLERHVIHGDLATQDEVDAYRPGGSENPGGKRSTWVWVRFYSQLVRMAGRAESTTVSDEEAWKADAQVLAALAADPVEVELVAEDKHGRRMKVDVHPKSLGALVRCKKHDLRIEWLGEHVREAHARDGAQDLEIVERAMAEIVYHYQVLTWIVTHPGPGLPFPKDDDRPIPPESLERLTPFDYPRICQAFHIVNGGYLEALEALIIGKNSPESAQRPSWSVFVGSMALKMGLKSSELMWDVSLGELLVASIAGTPPQPEEPEPALTGSEA